LVGYVPVAPNAEPALTTPHALHVAGIKGIPIRLEKLDVFAYPLLVPTLVVTAFAARFHLLPGAFRLHDWIP
jgi:hypothetical protein